MKFFRFKSQANSITKPKSGRIVMSFFVCLSLFSLVMVWVLSQQQESSKQAFAEISRFEVLDFEYYKISSLGVETYAIGRNAKETNKKISKETGKETNEESGILEQISVINYLFDEQKFEHLQSHLALFSQQEFFFPKGVNYARDTIKFWSEEATYQIFTKDILGKGEFKIFNKNYNIYGKNILYQKGKIYANHVHGIFTTERK